MSTTTKFMATFCGQRISDYGRQNGSVDYAALARSFDAVLCNEIVNTPLWEEAELVSARPDHTERLEKLDEELEKLESEQGELEAEQDYIAEVFQWYIISDEGAHILEQYLPYEVMYYVPALDVYVWGVCHWGTSWTYVLTGIPCETYDEERQRLDEYAAEEQELEQERMERETEAVRQEAEQTAKVFADILEQELAQSR